MSRHRPIITVTPNPAMDDTYTLDAFHPGQTHRVEAPQRRAGGKGLNVARVIHQNHRAILAIAPVGGRSGDEFTEELVRTGLAHTLIPVGAATRRSIAFVDSASGLTSIFNEYGSALKGDEWARLRSAVENHLASASCLVGSGSLPKDGQTDFYPWMVEQGKRLGLPVIIDSSGAALLDAAAAGADVLKPNVHELLEATGECAIDAAAMRLLELGARLVIVSLGEDGMQAFDSLRPGVVVMSRLGAPLEGNPTGAGDAAVAAIAASHADGAPETEAMLRRATAWSAAAVLMPVAGEIHQSHSELERQVVIGHRNLNQN